MEKVEAVTKNDVSTGTGGLLTGGAGGEEIVVVVVVVPPPPQPDSINKGSNSMIIHARYPHCFSCVSMTVPFENFSLNNFAYIGPRRSG